MIKKPSLVAPLVLASREATLSEVAQKQSGLELVLLALSHDRQQTQRIVDLKYSIRIYLNIFISMFAQGKTVLSGLPIQECDFVSTRD